MPQPITKPLIASSNFLEFSYEIVTSTYYHASLCFMTTVRQYVFAVLIQLRDTLYKSQAMHGGVAPADSN